MYKVSLQKVLRELGRREVRFGKMSSQDAEHIVIDLVDMLKITVRDIEKFRKSILEDLSLAQDLTQYSGDGKNLFRQMEEAVNFVEKAEDRFRVLLRLYKIFKIK